MKYDLVAPLVGAWIEMNPYLPLSGTGFVAPLVGAWIEIGISSHLIYFGSVAPLVGAWIEMKCKPCKSGIDLGRSPCGSVD